MLVPEASNCDIGNAAKYYGKNKMERIKWLYTTTEDYIYKSNIKLDMPYNFYSNCGKLLVSISADGEITVYKGYSWDGCTPKIKIFNRIFGTPDGKIKNNLPETYYASLIHDVLYQFLEFLPIKRCQADAIFLDLLRDYKYKYLYYGVVRLFGGFFV